MVVRWKKRTRSWKRSHIAKLSFFSMPKMLGRENGFSRLMPAQRLVVQGRKPNCDRYFMMTVA